MPNILFFRTFIFVSSSSSSSLLLLLLLFFFLFVVFIGARFLSEIVVTGSYATIVY